MYQNGTPHYNLPQTVGTDKRDWFDTNEAFAEIDAALYSANQTAQTASEGLAQTNENVTALETRVETAEGNITTLQGDLDTAEENIGINATAINDLTHRVDEDVQDLNDMITAYEEATATASMSHNVGDYFRYNDTLWITTITIRVGDTIVPNVNCMSTNVMARVKALEGGGGGATPLASSVLYDNEDSGLAATNVQDAIDEIDGTLDVAVAGVQELSQHLTANNIPFRFGYDSTSQKYGYIITEGGADTVIPFKSASGTYYVEDAGLIDVSDYEYVEVPRILAVSSGPTTYPSFSYTNPRDVAVQVKVKVSMTYSNVYSDAYMTVSVAGTEEDRVGLGVLVDKMYTVPAGSTLAIQGNLYNPAQHSGVQQTISGTVYAYDGATS